jgi:serine/threonine protein kinase
MLQFPNPTYRSRVFEDNFDIKVNGSPLKKAKYNVIHEPVTLRDRDNELLLDEIKILLTLQHESIFRYLGNSDKYLVFENSEVTLDYLISNNLIIYNLPGVLSSMLIVLKYIHKCGYIHGDITPKNIIFTEKVYNEKENEYKYFEPKLILTKKVRKGGEEEKEKDILDLTKIIYNIY